ncbi:MAG: carbamoyltransferase HypF, partial [Bacteroidetes bacterium]
MKVDNNFRNTVRIRVKGLVQGVGFRPFIYRLAHDHSLNGWVENSNDGVVIEVTGDTAVLEHFKDAIKKEAPQASNVVSITQELLDFQEFKVFEIVKSENASDAITDISPDIALCDDCLADLKTQAHRIDFPFINCTNCGPRFSIIKDLPYDREKTTMAPFIMCDVCRKEYTDVLDRRFHAQPVACNDCGPEYTLHLNGRTVKGIQEIVE